MRKFLNSDEHSSAGAQSAPQTACAPLPLPKRFYQDASVAEAEETAEGKSRLYKILLDGRAVKTPRRRLLAVPSQALAALIADEFRLQKQLINPAFMPVTRLANTVIDAIAADPQPVLEDMLRYLACDMVFYRAQSPQALVERQAKGWDTVLDWALAAMGADFQTAAGVRFAAQKPEALAAANAYLRRLFPGGPQTRYAAEGEPQAAAAEQPGSAEAAAPYRLAALHLMTNLTGSALLALMAQAGALPLPQAWELAHIEEDWTASRWGKDEGALQKRAAKERDFYAAAAVLAALKAPLSEQ